MFENRLDRRTIMHYQELMPEIALQTSAREREAIMIEREVDDMKIAEFMENKLVRNLKELLVQLLILVSLLNLIIQLMG